MATPEPGSPAPGSPLGVVVLACGDLGAEVADRLRRLPGVRVLALVTAPYVRRPVGLRQKLRRTLRAEGVPGLLRALGGRILRLGAPARTPPATTPRLDPAVPHLAFGDFHEPTCLAALRALAPDLGVVAGTYILRPEVFNIPRLGSINLHMGKVPEYRGAAPAFWELYNGERAVGITIHRVAAALDAGGILAQELFPLDPSPAEDPMAYLERYRREVLRPNGVRLLAETVRRIAAGDLTERPQDHERARTYRSPDYAAIRELRSRVRERRAATGSAR